MNMEKSGKMHKASEQLMRGLKTAGVVAVGSMVVSGDNPTKQRQNTIDLNLGLRDASEISATHTKTHKVAAIPDLYLKEDTQEQLTEAADEPSGDSPPDNSREDSSHETVELPGNQHPEITETPRHEILPEAKVNLTESYYELGFNVEETKGHASLFLNSLGRVMEKEEGGAGSFVVKKIQGHLAKKITEHKLNILNAIEKIGDFRKKTESYMELFEKDHMFGIDTDTKNIQINAAALVFELYKNGTLEKMFDFGFADNALVKGVLFVSAEKKDRKNLYEKLREAEKEISKTKKGDREIAMRMISEQLGRPVSWEECAQIDFLSVIVQEVSEPMSHIKDVPKTVQEYQNSLNQNSKKRNQFVEMITRVVSSNPEILSQMHALIGDFQKGK